MPEDGPKTYQEVPYAQLIQPAFMKDFAGKFVKFDAVYYGIQNVVMDLPSEYQKNYIRLQFCSSTSTGSLGGQAIASCENMYYNVVIAKDKSTPVFNLKQGQQVKVFAYAQKGSAMSAISGGTQGSLLLIVDSIEVIQ